MTVADATAWYETLMELIARSVVLEEQVQQLKDELALANTRNNKNAEQTSPDRNLPGRNASDYHGGGYVKSYHNFAGRQCGCPTDVGPSESGRTDGYSDAERRHLLGSEVRERAGAAIPGLEWF